MIETRFKSKISHLESFPLGAKEISDALAGSPQEERLELSFHRWSPNGWRWRRGRLANSYEHKQVVGRCEFRRRVRSLHSRAERNEAEHPIQWTLTVYSVPRNLRHRLSELLKSDALPRLHDWLIANQNPPNVVNDGQFEIEFDFLKEELQIATHVH